MSDMVPFNNNSDDNTPDTEKGTKTITRPKHKLKKPSHYKVILLNDDYTPMDFVVLVLVRFFRKTEQEATEIMLAVHNQGKGIAGVFPFEVAETKAMQCNQFAKHNNFPLKTVVEKDE